ncbi:hypothetical protein BDZ85DRAFT_267633 [Elsinoe ampelina]|uniref:DUF1996 domain-containing protein n=1 Tax=Elsinoe ampelina TaxID=302913 RepID=A0A6A6G433_9PEZI|nr:hypothetical protein BDZ85DRAFT_267633 [Elsinoe ampelina]
MLSTLISLSAAAGLANAYTVVVAGQYMLKNIDPLVVPGQYRSHMHSFFGSDAVTVNTTKSAEIMKGCSTVDNLNDLSVYWVPTLYTNVNKQYKPIAPMRFSAYYVAIESAEIPIPTDFTAIAGNAKATTQADTIPLAGFSWFCEGGPNKAAGADAGAFPTTTCSTHLQSLLLFHDCVNPSTLESAYSGTQNWKDGFKPANRCPAGMKRIPQLRFSIRYDLRKALPNGWSGAPPLELSCGPSYCFHGDFINGWVPEAAADMLKSNSKRDFRRVQGPNDSKVRGQDGLCNIKDAQDEDPDRGTSDLVKSREILAQA